MKKKAKSGPLVLKLHVQTQTTETFSIPMDLEPKIISVPVLEEPPTPLPILRDVQKKSKQSAKGWFSGTRGVSNFRSDDEDGYKINNQMSKFKFEMMKRRNTGAEPQGQNEEEELDEYIRFFEQAIDENNYEIIENMEMLYSCTAHYVSYYFSFQQFEERHDRQLKQSLVQGRLTFPDLISRFID